MYEPIIIILLIFILISNLVINIGCENLENFKNNRNFKNKNKIKNMSFIQAKTENLDTVTINNKSVEFINPQGGEDMINVANDSDGWKATNVLWPLAEPTTTGEFLVVNSLDPIRLTWATLDVQYIPMLTCSNVLTDTDNPFSETGTRYMCSFSNPAFVTLVNCENSVPMYHNLNDGTYRLRVQIACDGGVILSSASFQFELYQITSVSGGTGSSLTYNLSEINTSQITFTGDEINAGGLFFKNSTFTLSGTNNYSFGVKLVDPVNPYIGWNAGSLCDVTMTLEKTLSG